MDGISRALGCGVDVRLAGRTYLAAPLTLGAIGIVENHLLAERPLPHDTLAHFAAGVNDNTLRTMLAKKADAELKKNHLLRIVTSSQFHEYIEGPEGIVFTAWLCLRPNHQRQFDTLEHVERVFEKATIEEMREFVKRRNLASGFHLLADFDWSDPDERRRPSKRRKNRQQAEEKYQPFAWRKTLRYFAAEHHIDGVTVRDMTLYQARILFCNEQELDDLRLLDNAEAVATGTKGKRKPIVIGNNGKGLDELRKLRAEQKRGA